MIMSDSNSYKRRKMINNIHIHVCIVPKLKVKQRFWILTMKIHFIKIDLTTKWEYRPCKDLQTHCHKDIYRQYINEINLNHNKWWQINVLLKACNNFMKGILSWQQSWIDSKTSQVITVRDKINVDKIFFPERYNHINILKNTGK